MSAAPPRPDGPRVSVITVCLNSEATIGRCLQSVAQQDWPWVEHIVIDGGSADRTMDIVRDAHPRLSCVLSEPDRGIYDAMNKGLARARGDIICFLNADDAYVDAGVLAGVAERLRDPALDLVFGDVVFFKADRPEKIVRRYRSRHFSPRRLRYGWMPAHPALFMRREVFERTGRFRADYRIAGDFEYIARAFSQAPLRYEYLPRVFVRMQAGGVSNADLRARWRLNREVLRACRENGIRTHPLMLLCRYPAKFLEVLRP